MDPKSLKKAGSNKRTNADGTGWKVALILEAKM